ncbi:MAG: histidine phosphatase family protein [Candidatus Sungbacteria bacterium]|nr:histidine phosphatase family protein [Candidatus Sungbacteria bacterium]
MKLYLIRHGESESNASGYYLGKDSKLSIAGRTQARKLARRFVKIPINLVVASDYRRAISTAEIIGRVKKKKVVIIPFLGEERYPTEFERKHTNDPEVARMRRILRKNRNKKGWHYSDEENFFDLKLRIQKFLKVLGRRKEKSILAVGHGISNRMIVGLMLFG